jgi:general nucleoside transport system permease protein
MSSATTVATVPASPPEPPTDQWYPLRRSAEAILAPMVALVGAALLFSIFLLCLGASPMDFLDLVWRGAFGSWFSIQNTVQRASPLLLTALCVALPGQLGLVIIGGEAAVVLGGLAATVAALPLVNTSPVVVWAAMAVAGSAMGALWIGLSGWLRARLNVNEVIASLVLAYVGLALFNHFVEGVLRDPASLNKPSTYGIGKQNMLDTVPWLDVHPGCRLGSWRASCAGC